MFSDFCIMVSVLSRHMTDTFLCTGSLYKESDKMDDSIYRGVSLLSSTYKIFSRILLSSLTPYIDDAAGDH